MTLYGYTESEFLESLKQIILTSKVTFMYKSNLQTVKLKLKLLNGLYITGSEFFGLRNNFIASKVTFIHQKVVFAKPEVTTFLPEVEILKP